MVALPGVVSAGIRRVGRAVVFTLLAWTAVDVLNPALCGLDELPIGAVNLALDSGGLPVDSAPVAAEDCFCCSHNVNFTSITQVAVSQSAGREPRIAVDQNPRWASFPLYHPPRLLS